MDGRSRRGFYAAAMLAAIFSVILALSSRAEDPQPAMRVKVKHTLRYKLAPGEVLRTNVLHQVNLDTTISGNTQTAETTSGSVKVWRVKSVDPSGRVTFEHSVESVNMRQKATGREELTYNSKTDKQPPRAFEAVAKAIGVPLTIVTIDPSGKVLKRVETPNRTAAMGADPQNTQMVVPLPGQPIAVGESWNVPLDVTISLEEGVTKSIKTRQRYTLERVAHGVATILVETQVLTPVNDPKIQSQLIQRLTKGTIRFDMDAGRVLSQQLDLDEQVQGFNGPESILHYVGRFQEDYIPPPAKTATSRSATRTR